MFSVPFDMFFHYIAEDFVVQDTFFDEFVVAHTLGWWCKAIMIRNLPLLWVLSIGFEFCEVRSNSDTLPFRSRGEFSFQKHLLSFCIEKAWSLTSRISSTVTVLCFISGHISLHGG